MGRDTAYAAIDVGTTKVATLVARVSSQGTMEVVAMGHSTSQGMRKGLVVNPAELTDAVKRSVADAERMYGRKLPPVLVGITGGHLLPLSSASLSAMTGPAHQPGSAPLSRVWWPFLLAALLFLVAEVAVRRVTMPHAMHARWARWRSAREVTKASEPDYDALSATIAQERARRLAALRADAAPDAEDSAARARLYVAAGRNHKH